jgi:hypothetical protein
VTVGRAIQLFLIDGVATGRIACELFNWTGKAFKIPRRLLKESSDREELYKTGVYFLFGRDDADPDTQFVYVGEAEEVYKRLLQHRERDFWTEVVIFISKDENLNKAHIKFLEYETYTAIQKAKRAEIRNLNTPTRPVISEVDHAVMTEFLDNLKLLVGTLGYKVFQPLAQPLGKKADAYYINAARGAKARALVTSEGIVVTAGSHIASSCVPSTPEYVRKLRDKLMDSEVILKRDGSFRFTQDYLFPSPSTAAAVVLGRSANGRIEWKDKAGRTLRENEEGP